MVIPAEVPHLRLATMSESSEASTRSEVRKEGSSIKPENAMQALSPLGHSLLPFTTTGPDKK